MYLGPLRSTDIILVHAVQTCSVAPCQWDAWDADGRYYYLHFRWGFGWIGHNYNRDDAIDSFEDDGAPDILLESFCAFLGIRWQPRNISEMALENPPKRPRSMSVCGAKDGEYGHCTLPADHLRGETYGWHTEMRNGNIWAQWRGPIATDND